MAPRAGAVPAEAGRRPVGRPRLHDDDVERELILEAAYAALRDQGGELTVAHVLANAGVSTRSFYRHFATKDELLCAMYRRDSESVARRLQRRVVDATSPAEAVELWIGEIFSFVRDARRAERVAVLGSIAGSRADGAEREAAHARRLLVAPLRTAIERGIEGRSFVAADAASVADLVAAVVLHAAGLVAPSNLTAAHDEAAVRMFCLRALGAAAA